MKLAISRRRTAFQQTLQTQVMVFGMYLKNLFCGIIYDAYIKSMTMAESGQIMTQNERRVRNYERHLMKMRPWIPLRKVSNNNLIARLRLWLEKSNLELIVFCGLVVNFLADSIKTHDQTMWAST